MTAKNIKISGMHCEHCAKRVQKALSALEGTSNVSVDLAAGAAYLEVDESKVSVEALRQAVEDAGYSVTE